MKKPKRGSSLVDTKDWPVMRSQCPTCPFRVDARRQHADPELVGRIQTQCLSTASQICHHPALHGKPETRLCRGARNFQLIIFHRLGLIEAPTDRAWAARAKLVDKV